MRTRVVPFLMIAACLSWACSSGGGDEADAGSKDTTQDLAVDGAEVAPDTADTAKPDVDPGGACLDDLDPAKRFDLPGLEQPVEVVIDEFGVPHVFAQNEHDLFLAEGFIVARFRFVQMHAMRRIASGDYARSPAAGPGDLATDVYMRTLGLRRAAEGAWTDIAANDPGPKAMMEAFAQGVNVYIDMVKSRKIDEPLEWGFLGEIEPWTPVDSLTVGRLQSWDLSFEGNGDKIDQMQRMLTLGATYAGTAIEGIEHDLYPLTPATDTISLPGGIEVAQAPAPKVTPKPALAADYLKGVRARLATVMQPGAQRIPGFGSNNCTVSGDLTESGAAMVANDTHLSLRNPAVFFQIHLNTARAGGDLDLAGVCFPGIPGLILGHNGFAAWGATVYYADVTDVYVERWTAGDPASVTFKGEQVPVTVRDDVFTYAKPAEGCESWIGGLILGTRHEVTEADGGCTLTVHSETVPHHGPVIPGSVGKDPAGNDIALTWKWTGFEPSRDLVAVYGLMKMRSTADFLDALKDFSVGAQNWVYADRDGHIAYAAFAKVPVRAHLKTAPVEHPPWLPFPGSGCCEWEGMVPMEDMPHAVDPAAGFIATANGDALGYTLDGDPLNDPTYQGYGFAIGLRAGRLHELIAEHTANGGKLDLGDMQAIQADHLSPMGKRLTMYILDAVEAAEKAKADDVNVNPAYAPFATDTIGAARDRLADWDFQAEAGTGDGATDAQKKSAVATSIFNVWLVHVSKAILDNKGVTPYDMGMQAKFLLNLFEKPETMATYSPVLGDSAIWDDVTTADVQEDRNLIILAALQQALAFLADPTAVGPAQAGGFGTDDMSQWLWGKLHTVTLRSALGGEANIPPESSMPEGYPRHGDNFVLDAAHPGLSDTIFTFRSGAAIRNVFTALPEGMKADTVIPGGQDGNTFQPHYKDLFDLWATNQTHALETTPAEIRASAEACWRLLP